MNDNNVQKHTQEPWGYDVNGVITGGPNLCTSICVTSQHQWERKEGLGTWLDDQHRKQLVSESKANAKRIVECVNACKGIENPNTIPAILSERDRIRASNAKLLEACKISVIAARFLSDLCNAANLEGGRLASIRLVNNLNVAITNATKEQK